MSPNEWRTQISSLNDGSMPREPYQRCSQSIFEAWLKNRIKDEPLIEMHFGLKFESYQEVGQCIESISTSMLDGAKYTTRSQYLVGCDGAGSRVRKCLGSYLIGGPT